MNQALRKRVERAEEAVRLLLRVSPECICFPDQEQPTFYWRVEWEIAARLKCPVHGDRFRLVPFRWFYVADWILEKPDAFLAYRSPKFRKAWYASFPPELWPAREISIDGKGFLELKDGSILSMDTLQESSMRNIPM